MKRMILIFSIPFHSLTTLNAQTWSALGTGIGANTYHAVYALAEYNNEVYAGGYFTSAGGVPVNNIAKWNGTNWSPVGSGTAGGVNALCVYNGELYAGGPAANQIARWNGTDWSGAGSPNCNLIKALAVYSGELYVAGHFYFPGGAEYGTAIGKWNGSAWSPVGNGVEPAINTVECLTEYNGELYVAGAQIGDGGVANSYSVLRWNGSSWSTIVTIPATLTLDGALGDILSMTVYNGELYIAGSFSMVIDSVVSQQIAKWNGAYWSAVGRGINIEVNPLGGDSDGSTYSFVKTLSVYNGALYAGGSFSHADTVITRNIAKWDGVRWSCPGQGVNGHVYSLMAADTNLYVGGSFNAVDGTIIPANTIARWDDSPVCSSVPLQPGSIDGNSNVCSSTAQTYFISPVPGATYYTWNLPTGWSGTSYSTSISVVAGSGSGTISVAANNACGRSLIQTLAVVARSVPSQPGVINGNNMICEGATQTYSIEPVEGATHYMWILPSGWSGQSFTDTITLMPHGGNGTIAVNAYNECGSSITRTLPIGVATIPDQPGNIEGNDRVCLGATQYYYVTEVTGATSYEWILPSGWPGHSTSNSISTTTGNVNGLISVKATNACGSSPFRILPISVDSIPPMPGDITGNVYTSTNFWNFYSIDPVIRATSYNWVTAEGTVEHGPNNHSVSALWKKAGVYDLSVKAVNNCGMSAARKIMVTVTDPKVDDPFAITVTPNPSNGLFYLNAKSIQGKWISIEANTIAGQLVYRRAAEMGTNNYTQLIELKNLPSGIYIIRIIIDDKVYVRRVVKSS